jgi:neutral ceramidase
VGSVVAPSVDEMMTMGAGSPGAGVASIDITPDWPVMQGGFGQRTEPSAGVLDPVRAKALYLVGDDDAVLLITADLIAIPRPIAAAVVARLALSAGLQERQVCICASHTHSGPLPYGPGAPGVDRYTEFLIDALCDVASAAMAELRPCALGTGTGEIDVLFNRRTRGRPNRVDPRVPVLVVSAIDVDGTPSGGDPLAVVFGAGCHPVTLGWDNMDISGDYPGVAQRVVEEQLPATVAMFFNTTEADVIPVTSPNCDALDPRGYHGGSPADMTMIGNALARAVLQVVPVVQPSTGAPIGSARRDVLVRANNASFDLETAQQRLAAAREVLAGALGGDFEQRAGGYLWALASQYVVETDCSEDEMRAVMIACCEYLGLSARVARGRDLDPVTVPIQVLRLGDLELVALPGEPLVAVGEEWSRRTGSDHAYVIGLANAHHRYLPLQQHFDLPDAREQYDTVTAGLESGAVDRLLDDAASMLAEC